MSNVQCETPLEEISDDAPEELLFSNIEKINYDDKAELEDYGYSKKSQKKVKKKKAKAEQPKDLSNSDEDETQSKITTPIHMKWSDEGDVVFNTGPQSHKPWRSASEAQKFYNKRIYGGRLKRRKRL